MKWVKAMDVIDLINKVIFYIKATIFGGIPLRLNMTSLTILQMINSNTSTQSKFVQ